MNGDAVKEVARLAVEAGGAIVIDGVTYAGPHLKAMFKTLPSREVLKLSTLAGLVDYIKADPDKVFGSDPLILHVAAENLVSLRGLPRADDTHSREAYASASYQLQAFSFGTFMDRESFNISLQSQFAHEADWEKVIGFISSIVDEQSVTSKDNGVSQTVAARKGVVHAEKVEVPNPVTLAPFRSFSDVGPIHSKFILRVRGGGGSPVTVALFESDGGRWRLDTVERIHKHLAHVLSAEIAAGKFVLVR